MRDGILTQWWYNVIESNWADDDSGPHLVNAIARSKGWLPLNPGEEMSVVFGGTQYLIRREKESK